MRRFLSAIRGRVGTLSGGRKRNLEREIKSLRGAVELMRERIERIDEDGRETRWLALETRRNIYSRICEPLAPDVHVASDYEPKVLVTLRNDVTGLTDDAKGEYFSLVPSEGSRNGNKWVADASLSRYIVSLMSDGEHDERHLRLGLVGLDGRVREVGVRWNDIQHVRGASEIGRAILTIDSRPHIGAFEKLNAIVATLTVNDVGAILIRHGRLVPAISEVRKRSVEDAEESS